VTIHRPRKRPLSRYQRDARLSYSALAVSAIAFVMVLVASFVVIKVAPDTDLRVPSALNATQPVVKHPPIRPLATRTPPTQDAGEVEAGAGTPGATDAAASPVVTPGGPQPAPTPDPAPQPTPQPTPTEPDGPDPGGPETPTPPPPAEPTRPGPTSSLVDPVVEAISGTLDQVSGGATQPVTGPVGDLSDDVTDVVDGLLGHR